MTDQKPAKAEIDWELAERHYRAGILSLRQIADECGITEGAVRKRAKKDQWTRNLSAKIQQRAEEKVRKAAVRIPSTQLTPVSEKQVVEENAELQYRIRMEHRQDIGRTRKLFQALLGEVEAASSIEGQGLINQLFQLLNDEPDPDSADADRKRYDAMRKKLELVLSTTGRIDSAKKLTEMLEKLVKLEREAFGIITEAEGKGGSVDDLLAKMRGME